MNKKVTPINNKDDQKERLINTHIKNKKRISSIFTKIKRKSNDRTYIDDLQNLQNILNNNFYFQLLKTSKVSQQQQQQEIPRNSINKVSQITNVNKQNLVYSPIHKQKIKYQNLMKQVQSKTKKLMLSRIQQDDIIVRLNDCLLKQTQKRMIETNSQGISPMVSFTNLSKICSTVETPKVLKKKSIYARKSVGQKYQMLHKKIQAVGSQLSQQYENKMYTIYNKQVNFLNSNQASAKSIYSSANILSRNIKLRKHIKTPSALPSAKTINSKRDKTSQASSFKNIRYTQTDTLSQIPTQMIKKPIRQRKGLLFRASRKSVPVKQRDIFMKKVDDFLTFTDNAKKILESSNSQFSGLIQQMQNINKEDYDQMRQSNLQIDYNAIRQITSMRQSLRYQK